MKHRLYYHTSRIFINIFVRGVNNKEDSIVIKPMIYTEVTADDLDKNRLVIDYYNNMTECSGATITENGEVIGYDGIEYRPWLVNHSVSYSMKMSDTYYNSQSMADELEHQKIYRKQIETYKTPICVPIESIQTYWKIGKNINNPW